MLELFAHCNSRKMFGNIVHNLFFAIVHQMRVCCAPLQFRLVSHWHEALFIYWLSQALCQKPRKATKRPRGGIQQRLAAAPDAGDCGADSHLGKHLIAEFVCGKISAQTFLFFFRAPFLHRLGLSPPKTLLKGSRRAREAHKPFVPRGPPAVRSAASRQAAKP